jgi:hypothetical protein
MTYSFRFDLFQDRQIQKTKARLRETSRAQKMRVKVAAGAESVGRDSNVF